MNLRVEGDGTPTGTRVFTAAGEDISNMVAAVHFHHEGGQAPVVEVDVHLPRVGFLGEGKVYFGGRQVARIIYADGGEEEF